MMSIEPSSIEKLTPQSMEILTDRYRSRSGKVFCLIEMESANTTIFAISVGQFINKRATITLERATIADDEEGRAYTAKLFERFIRRHKKTLEKITEERTD